MSHATTYDAADLAFDPAAHPELYDGVRTRRIFGFLVDAAVVIFLMVVAYRRHRHFGRLHLRARLVPHPSDLAGGSDPLCGADPRRPLLRHARHALHGHRNPHG